MLDDVYVSISAPLHFWFFVFLCIDSWAVLVPHVYFFAEIDVQWLSNLLLLPGKDHLNLI